MLINFGPFQSPSNFQDRLKYRPGGGISTARGGHNAAMEGTGDYANEKKLVALHKKLLVARQNLWRLEAKWEALLKKAFKLEDIVKSKSSGTRLEKRRRMYIKDVKGEKCEYN